MILVGLHDTSQYLLVMDPVHAPEGVYSLKIDGAETRQAAIFWELGQHLGINVDIVVVGVVGN